MTPLFLEAVSIAATTLCASIDPTLLRTVGLRFAVLRGNPYESEAEGDWIAVSLYGTIGAPIKGLEHETFGVGINAHERRRLLSMKNRLKSP